MKILSLFSGIGAFEKGFERAGYKVKTVNYCEIDKYASKAYSVIHDIPESKNLGDITKVDADKIKGVDVVTYGFPCQDISVAGKQKGFGDNGELTRSGLFFYAADIIKKVQPKVAICENVKALTSKKFTKEFQTVLETLEEAGYKNYWQVLNAKDYGIPQNRERVFIISVRNDIDKEYVFPKPKKLKLRLKDMLESEVDEKYYLKEERIENFKYGSKGKLQDSEGISNTLMAAMGQGGGNIPFVKPKIMVVGNTKSGGQKSRILSSDGISTCLTATDYKQPIQIAEPNRLGGIFDTEKSKHQAGSIWDKECCGPTIDTMQGGYRQPLITEPLICASRGRKTDDGYKQRLEPNTKGISNTLTTVQKDNLVAEPTIIREKPIEREGWHRNAKEVLNVNGICRTLSTQSNNLATKIAEPTIEVQVAETMVSANISESVRKNVVREYADIVKTDKNIYKCECNSGWIDNQVGINISPTLRASNSLTLALTQHYRIRKLTPKECWRLMGFEDSDIDKCIEAGISNTQLYKMAGNSIVVDVITAIAKQMKKCGVLK